jgi:hypothetical protein
MNWGYLDSAARCPYYDKIKVVGGKTSVICESVIEGVAAINILGEDFERHFKTCCSGDWKKCPHAIAISRKYDT